MKESDLKLVDDILKMKCDLLVMENGAKRVTKFNLENVSRTHLKYEADRAIKEVKVKLLVLLDRESIVYSLDLFAKESNKPFLSSTYPSKKPTRGFKQIHPFITTPTMSFLAGFSCLHN